MDNRNETPPPPDPNPARPNWIPILRLAAQQLGIKRANPKMVRRWRSEGLLTPDKRRVKLHARKLGGRWYSTVEDWERFVAAVNGDDLLPATELTASQRDFNRRVKKAEEELRRLGVKR